MINTALHLPVSFLREAFNDRSGVPLDNFELYYRGKRLEGEAALSSWGLGKDSTIEVKMRGRGGMPLGMLWLAGEHTRGRRSGPQLSRPEDRASAEATLALETATASAASSTQAAEELMLSEVATNEAVEVSVEAEGKAARTLIKEDMGL